MKTDKGNGVVLVNNKDYTISVGNLFKDTKKFKTLESYHTITQMKTLQTLHENCPNTEFFSGPYSVQIMENTDQKKLRIWILFVQIPHHIT